MLKNSNLPLTQRKCVREYEYYKLQMYPISEHWKVYTKKTLPMLIWSRQTLCGRVTTADSSFWISVLHSIPTRTICTKSRVLGTRLQRPRSGTSTKTTKRKRGNGSCKERTAIYQRLLRRTPMACKILGCNLQVILQADNSDKNFCQWLLKFTS